LSDDAARRCTELRFKELFGRERESEALTGVLASCTCS
jgi:hypothetical protein